MGSTLTVRGGEQASVKSLYDFTVKDIDGKEVKLSDYKGKVLLIVNVASECGLTKPTYPQLESLYRKYKDKGLSILAFPANNFGKQEPGSNDQIKAFCTEQMKVTFDLFAKISVMGDDQAPLYQFLTNHEDEKVRGPVVWNFQKYLVGRDGRVWSKFSPRTMPEDSELIDALEKALAQDAP
jgi:glutathione peroxidase